MKKGNKNLNILIPTDLKHYEVSQAYKTTNSFIEPQKYSSSVKRQPNQNPILIKKHDIQQRRFTSESFEQQQQYQTDKFLTSPYNLSYDYTQPNVLQNIVTNNIYLQNLFIQSGKNSTAPQVKMQNKYYTPTNKYGKQQFTKFAKSIEQQEGINSSNIKHHGSPKTQMDQSNKRQVIKLVQEFYSTEGETLEKKDESQNNRQSYHQKNKIKTLGTETTQIAKNQSVPSKITNTEQDQINRTLQTRVMTFKQKQIRLKNQNIGTRPQIKIKTKTISDDEQICKMDNLVTRIPQGGDMMFRKSKIKTQSLNMPTIQAQSFGSQNLSQLQSPQMNFETSYYMKKMGEFLQGQNKDSPFHQIYLDHFSQNYGSMQFSKQLKPCDPRQIKQKQQSLKPRSSQYQKTVIFDLDETLIHCNENSSQQSDIYLPIVFPHGEIIEAGINIRPYAVYILSELSKLCEVIVFTASHSSYASKVLDHLDPQKQWISQRLFRQHCTLTPESVHVKDLRVLCADRSLKDMVIIDNAAYSFGYQINNGIPIIPYYDNKDDTELLDLLEYLKMIIKYEDMREVNKYIFKMNLYQDCISAEQASQKIC